MFSFELQISLEFRSAVLAGGWPLGTARFVPPFLAGLDVESAKTTLQNPFRALRVHVTCQQFAVY